MRRMIAAGLAAGLMTTTAALAQDAAEPAAPAYDADTVVATVNGVDITLGHMVVLTQRLPQQYQQLPDEVLFPGILEQLVDQQLLAETLEADPPREVRLHVENERRGSLAQAFVRNLIAEEIAEDELRAAYDAAYGDYEPTTEYNASHILVATEEEAAALLAEIQEGADFADVAREHSLDGAAQNGGQLGWFGAGRMVAEFEQAVMAMEVDEVAGPVETQFGWHLIRLNETRETEPPTFEQVAQDLANELRQTRLEAALAELREAATIEMPGEDLPPAAIRDGGILAD